MLNVFVCLSFIGCATRDATRAQTDRIFERKVQCETYASKTEKEFKDAGRELTGGKDQGIYSVERIFYSHKRNSCVCILRYTSFVRGETFEVLQVLDVLTKEDLWSKSYSGAEGTKMKKDIEDQIMRLE